MPVPMMCPVVYAVPVQQIPSSENYEAQQVEVEASKEVVEEKASLTDDGDHERRVSMLGKVMTSCRFRLKAWERKRKDCLLKLKITPVHLPDLTLPKQPDKTKNFHNEQQQQWRLDFNECWKAWKTAHREAKIQWEKVPQAAKESALRELGYNSFELPQLQLPNPAADGHMGHMTKGEFQKANNALRAWMEHGEEVKAHWSMM